MEAARGRGTFGICCRLLDGLPFALQGSLLLNFFFSALFLLESGLDHGLVYRVGVAAMRVGCRLLAYGPLHIGQLKSAIVLSFDCVASNLGKFRNLSFRFRHRELRLVCGRGHLLIDRTEGESLR